MYDMGRSDLRSENWHTSGRDLLSSDLSRLSFGKTARLPSRRG
jgi:hypothetical protein